MSADDDFYVPSGSMLSENSELTEPEVLFTNNWDIKYLGLATTDEEEIKIKTSGSTKYQLDEPSTTTSSANVTVKCPPQW